MSSIPLSGQGGEGSCARVLRLSLALPTSLGDDFTGDRASPGCAWRSRCSGSRSTRHRSTPPCPTARCASASSSSSLKPSPSQPSPCIPMISIASSARSCVIRAPTFFMIEVAADGPWFDFASSAARRSVSAKARGVHLVPDDPHAQVGVGDPALRRPRRDTSWRARPSGVPANIRPARRSAARQAVALVLEQPLADRPALPFAARPDCPWAPSRR